ncbi:MAG: cell division protein FtsL [Hydrogenophilus sp.]|nr:cell division protein FtsL [Hydrogenophilus sp.]
MAAHWWDGVLLGAVVGSALAVVTLAHESREVVQELERERARAARLDTEWRRLQIERAAWSDPATLQAVARERLPLRPPAPNQIRRWEVRR